MTIKKHAPQIEEVISIEPKYLMIKADIIIIGAGPTGFLLFLRQDF